ncbi:MAG TPA: hypothetical protein VHR88_09755 [Solirubrobacteraceae bacterium]|nr:hypothetical protein [Solirubrobacteraceae bacterium]
MVAPARTRPSRRRTLGIAAGLLVLVVLLVGGYAGHWAWTGFSDNDTLWDWLQLLLLPVVIAGLPIWLAHGDFMERRVRILAACLLVAFVALVVLGYAVPWKWTGFPGNKLWDWLVLIMLPVVVATIRLWPEVRRRFSPRHAAAFTALVSALVALILVGYLRPWTWTGFTGNTLWDWIQLLAVPLLVPTVVVPVALSYMRAGVEERELEAGVTTKEPTPQPAPDRAPPPPWRARATVVAVSAGVALLVGGVVGALAFGNRSSSTSSSQRTTAAAASAPCASAAATTLAGNAAGRVIRVGQTYYACPTGHKPIVLGTGRKGSAPGSFAVSPARVAFVNESCPGGVSSCAAQVKVARVSDGHIFNPQNLQGAHVAALAVTPSGGLAVMLRDPPKLLLLQGGKMRSAATGPGLDTGSLAQAGGTVYWRANGQTASAQL